MKKRLWIVFTLLFACILLALMPLIMIKNSEFSGSDDLAEELIQEIEPEYEPWFKNLVEPPSKEMESFLFSVQAAIGTLILGYGFGYLKARKKYE